MQQENIPIKVGLLELLNETLSSTSAIILHGSRNGWEYWMNEDGVQLGLVEGLRKNNE